MKIQMFLSMQTDRPTLRCLADAWDCEDPRGYVAGKAIGHTPGPSFRYDYDNVMQAMAAGWCLLSPPVKNEDSLPRVVYDWYLVKEVEK